MEHKMRTDYENLPASSGLSAIIANSKGERLSMRKRILGKCCECMGYYIDGRADCGVKACILHVAMPYRADRVKRGKKTPITTANIADCQDRR